MSLRNERRCWRQPGRPSERIYGYSARQRHYRRTRRLLRPLGWHALPLETDMESYIENELAGKSIAKAICRQLEEVLDTRANLGNVIKT